MKILIPIDGNRLSQAAVDFVAARSTLIGSAPQVTLVNAQWPLAAQAQRIVGRAAARAFYREQAQKIAQPALAQLARAGLPARLQGAAEAIAREASRSGADLIASIRRGKHHAGPPWRNRASASAHGRG